MDLLTLAFLALMVLMGGVIAVAADRLGRRLGKKRLSLFGLRPRHTAEGITFGAGLLIPLVTIAVMYVASSDVREWINEGRRAIASLNKTQQELGQAQKQLVLVQEFERKAKADAASESKKNVTLTKQNAELSQDREAKASEVASLNVQLRAGKQTLAQRQRLIAQLGPRVRSLTAELGTTQNQLRATRTQLRTDKRRLAQVIKDRQRETEKYVAAAQQANETNQRNLQLEQEASRLEKSIKALTEETDELEERVATLTRARDEAQRELTASQTELTRTQIELSQAQSQLQFAAERLGRVLAGAEQLVDATRIRPLIFGYLEEVARVPIRATPGSEGAKVAVDLLLHQAREKASAAGAKPRETYPVAGLFERALPDGRKVGPEELQRELVRIVSDPAKAKEEQVLVAYASVNTFEGEPVSLEVAVFPNPVVYREGQVVAESAIDGSKEEPAILRELSEFVAKKVRMRAERDRMIFRRGENASFASVPPEDILALVQQVRAAARPVRVAAVAQAETRAGDTLRLDFKVR